MTTDTGATDTGSGSEVDDDTDSGASEQTDWKAEAEKWKALARKHEKRAADNAKAAEKLQELEDADKSDMERLSSKLSEAEKRAEAAELRALRLEVAAEKGLTPAQAKRLAGSNREELEADADEIVEVFGSADGGKGAVPSRRPKADGTPAGAEDRPDPEPSEEEIIAAVPRL